MFSNAIGERILLAEIRKVKNDTLIFMSGFNCKEQVFHQIEKRPLLSDEVLNMSIGNNTL